MQLLVNTLLTEERLGTYYERGDLNNVHTRIDIFKYMINTLSEINWTSAFIYFDLDSNYGVNKDDLAEWISNKISNSSVFTTRLTNSIQWSRAVVELRKQAAHNECIWYCCNDDHIIIKQSHEIIESITHYIENNCEKFPFIQCQISHWSMNIAEYIRIKAKTPWRIIQETKDYVVIPSYEIGSAHIISPKLLEYYWLKTSFLGENLHRSDLGQIQSPPTMLVVPKTEIARHYDGYSHHGTSIRWVSPLEITEAPTYTSVVKNTARSVRLSNKDLNSFPFEGNRFKTIEPSTKIDFDITQRLKTIVADLTINEIIDPRFVKIINDLEIIPAGLDLRHETVYRVKKFNRDQYLKHSYCEIFIGQYPIDTLSLNSISKGAELHDCLKVLILLNPSDNIGLNRAHSNEFDVVLEIKEISPLSILHSIIEIVTSSGKISSFTVTSLWFDFLLDTNYLIAAYDYFTNQTSGKNGIIIVNNLVELNNQPPALEALDGVAHTRTNRPEYAAFSTTTETFLAIVTNNPLNVSDTGILDAESLFNLSDAFVGSHKGPEAIFLGNPQLVRRLNYLPMCSHSAMQVLSAHL